MALIASDDFTGSANGTLLQNRSGWVRATSYVDPAYATIESGRVFGQGYSVNYYRTETPASADQSVQADIYAIAYGTEAGKFCFIAARMDSAVNTCYVGGRADGMWVITRRNNNAVATLATSAADYYHSASKTVKLEVTGTGATVDLKLYVNGVLTLSASDSSVDRITSVGKVGLRVSDGNNQIDNWTASTIDAGVVTHTSTGALVASASTLSGTSARSGAVVTHASSGALTGQAATLSGTAARAGAVVTHAATGALVASAATLAGTSARVAASGSFATDILINNTGTPLTSTAVSWSWLPLGRIGSLAAITPVDGTGTTSGTGVLTVTGLSPGAGILMVADLNTGPTDDAVYYQAGTVA